MRPGAGRPKKPKAEKQSVRVVANFTPVEARELEAEAEGESLSTFLRNLALRFLQRRRR